MIQHVPHNGRHHGGEIVCLVSLLYTQLKAEVALVRKVLISDDLFWSMPNEEPPVRRRVQGGSCVSVALILSLNKRGVHVYTKPTLATQDTL